MGVWISLCDGLLRWVFVWLLLGCGGRVCVYVTWLVLVEPMCIQTTIGSAKKLAALQEDKFGEGALSFSNSKSDKRKNKNNLRKKVVLVYECLLSGCFLLNPCEFKQLLAVPKISVLCKGKIWGRGPKYFRQQR